MQKFAKKKAPLAAVEMCGQGSTVVGSSLTREELDPLTNFMHIYRTEITVVYINKNGLKNQVQVQSSFPARIQGFPDPHTLFVFCIPCHQPASSSNAENEVP